MAIELGIDVGGTFTDFVFVDSERNKIFGYKMPTVKSSPIEAVIGGLVKIMEQHDVELSQVGRIVNATTLLNNAIIERNGPTIGMLCTKGFGSVLDIGREQRYDLYDPTSYFPAPFVVRPQIREIEERISFDGSITIPINRNDVICAVEELRQQNVSAIAVCFLHSYKNPVHEEMVADWIEKIYPDMYISTSADVFRFEREYERWTTTTINTYSQPVMDKYIEQFEEWLDKEGFGGQLFFMTSDGGMVGADLAKRYPVKLLESGAAAAALMGVNLCNQLDISNGLVFDMGGTTAKGALIKGGQVYKRYDVEVARVREDKKGSGLPVCVPVIDLVEIGIGGGSIAGLDTRNVIQVGPKSTGSDPGPACFNRGGKEATVTDANFILGYYDQNSFRESGLTLCKDSAFSYIEKLGEKLEVDPGRAAWGVHATANQQVARAFRNYAANLAVDYQNCTLIASGGSSALHVVEVARELHIPKVIIPMMAGVLPALGLLCAPVKFEVVQSHRIPLSSLTALKFSEQINQLVQRGLTALKCDAQPRENINYRCCLDMRYIGQGFEIEVTLPEEIDNDRLVVQLKELFSERYKEIYSNLLDDEPLEITAWKVEIISSQAKTIAIPPKNTDLNTPCIPVKNRKLYCPGSGKSSTYPVYERHQLCVGQHLTGPAIIEDTHTSCVIGEGDLLEVDRYGHLLIELNIGESLA